MSLPLKLVLSVLAFLFPPLAVAIKEDLREHFWINILLTLLAYVPGLIHALFCIWCRKPNG